MGTTHNILFIDSKFSSYMDEINKTHAFLGYEMIDRKVLGVYNEP